MDCQAEKVDRPLDPEDTCHALDAPEPDQLGVSLEKSRLRIIRRRSSTVPATHRTPAMPWTRLYKTSLVAFLFLGSPGVRELEQAMLPIQNSRVPLLET